MKNPGEVVSRTLDSFSGRLEARADFCLPERRYSHFGEVAFDCEQFVVNGVGITQGAGGPPGAGFTSNPAQPVFTYLQVDVMIVRSVPNLDDIDEPPTPSALDASAAELGLDVLALTETFELAFAGSTDEIVGSCDNVYNGGIAWVGPAGDLIATILTFYVQL